jgi:tRNA (guanine37-N1)-methyltransferase
LEEDRAVEIRNKISRGERDAGKKAAVVKKIVQPKVFQHYVLNLPASAIAFLSSFVGLYPPEMRNTLPDGTKMPLIHVHTFSTKDELEDTLEGDKEDTEPLVNAVSDIKLSGGSEKSKGAVEKICAAISEQLGYTMCPGAVDEDGGVEVYDVRDVAPKKRMFCATFRLPEAVAFRETGTERITLVDISHRNGDGASSRAV